MAIAEVEAETVTIERPGWPATVLRPPESRPDPVAVGQVPQATDAPYPVPSPQAFGGLEYLRAPDLAAVADRLIVRHEARFGYLSSVRVVYLWQVTGAVSKGRPVWSKVQLGTGLVGYYAQADLVLTFAADQLRQVGLLGITGRQLEALVYHELSHTLQDEKGRLRLVPHEFEGFRAELELYGAWAEDLQELVATVRQLPLWDTGEEEQA